jgi:hypothetical protein
VKLWRRRSPRGAEQSVGVIYLAWHGLGRATFQRFADSYRDRPAGCKHDLIVIYAGFEQQADLQDAASVFRDIRHVAIEIPEIRLDIGYYLEAARRVSHQYLCFLNTYTQLIASNWLGHFYKHASRAHVGIVGATGSYESLADSIGMQQRVIWLCRASGNKVDEQTALYFNFLLDETCPSAIVEPLVKLPPHGIERWMEQAARFMSKCERDDGFRARWETLTQPGRMFANYRHFPTFPNPHIRTSGFMVRRLQLAAFEPSQIKTKMDAHAFESSAAGLTAQLRRAGLTAIVVTKDGRGYDVRQWPRSRTFRLGEQQNLILTDNRSRDFAGMSPAERALHVRITWGDYVGRPPVDFPDYGYAFAKAPLDPDRRQHIPGRPPSQNRKYKACKRALRLMRRLAPALSRRSGMASSR